MTKRFFIKWIPLYFLFSSSAFGFSMAQVYGPLPHKNFVQLFYKRLLTWLQQNESSSYDQLSSQEKEFINEWVNTAPNWGEIITEQQIFENFQFCYNVTNGVVKLESLFIAHSNWPEELKVKFYDICKSRARSLTNRELGDLYGISWNFLDSSFELHFKFNNFRKLDHKLEVYNWAVSSYSPLWHKTFKHVEHYSKDRKKIDDCLVFALKETNYNLFPKGFNLDVKSAQKSMFKTSITSWKWYLKSLFVPLLNPKIHPIVNSLKSQFHLSAHALNYKDKDNFKIYYP